MLEGLIIVGARPNFMKAALLSAPRLDLFLMCECRSSSGNQGGSDDSDAHTHSATSDTR